MTKFAMMLAILVVSSVSVSAADHNHKNGEKVEEIKEEVKEEEAHEAK